MNVDQGRRPFVRRFLGRCLGSCLRRAFGVRGTLDEQVHIRTR